MHEPKEGSTAVHSGTAAAGPPDRLGLAVPLEGLDPAIGKGKARP